MPLEIGPTEEIIHHRVQNRFWSHQSTPHACCRRTSRPRPAPVFLCSPYASGGVERSFLRTLETRFSLRRRSRLAAVGRVGVRGSSTCCHACRRVCIRSNAASRLACCDLRSVAVTVRPVGRWTNRTPVWTLLRCCPPGPLAIRNARSQSRSSASRSVGYLGAPIPLPCEQEVRDACCSLCILSHVRTYHHRKRWCCKIIKLIKKKHVIAA